MGAGQEQRPRFGSHRHRRRHEQRRHQRHPGRIPAERHHASRDAQHLVPRLRTPHGGRHAAEQGPVDGRAQRRVQTGGRYRGGRLRNPAPRHGVERHQQDGGRREQPASGGQPRTAAPRPCGRRYFHDGIGKPRLGRTYEHPGYLLDQRGQRAPLRYRRHSDHQRRRQYLQLRRDHEFHGDHRRQRHRINRSPQRRGIGRHLRIAGLQRRGAHHHQVGPRGKSHASAQLPSGHLAIPQPPEGEDGQLKTVYRSL